MKQAILGILAVVVLTVGVLIATADSKEEKAVKQYASAQELVAEGDIPRAMVELRNALQNDPNFREARMRFADLLLTHDFRSDAYAQYRYVIERDPEDIEAARALAKLAFDNLGWKDARTFSDTVLGKEPQNADMLAIRAGLDYRDALEKRDTDGMERAASAADKLLAADPTQLRARRVLISNAMREGDLDRTLALVDAGLALDPGNRDLHGARLLVLERQGRTAETEAQLQAMIALFPTDEELKTALVRFYMRADRIDEAEALLRARITPEETSPAPRLVLLRFLEQIRSPEAMRAELQKVLAEDPPPKDVADNRTQFRILLAQADFAVGERDKAQADVEALLKDAAPSDATDRTKVALARMRLAAGNTVGSRALVEEILAHDPRQTEAIKLKSSWLIEEDQTEPAIALLRDALADSPNDAQVLSLMAHAYQREGKPELMAEMLARAVEVSNQAPQESLRYATLLLQKGDFIAAESVLIDALRRQPQNLDLLTLLTRAHIGMQDWMRAQQDIEAITQRFDTDAARTTGQELQAQLLAERGQNDQLGQFLDGLARENGGSLGPRLALVRNNVIAGKLDLARDEVAQLVQDFPDDAAPRLLMAQIDFAQNRFEDGVAKLRDLAAAHPDTRQAWLLLQAYELSKGQYDAALATLDEGLTHLPGTRELQMAKAYLFERMGRIDDAIALYEAMYAEDSNDSVLANNLASLIATNREDPESLDRAWVVARRLNGVPVPAFQDTWGWIAFRRGETEQALPALEAAAKGLPNDPSVAYHLGRAYAALAQTDAARAEYDRAEALLTRGLTAYPALPQDLIRARAALK